MELYKKHPVITTLWAFMEVVLFAGVIFGWGSLVYILKEEGFYLDTCAENNMNAVPTLLSQELSMTFSNQSLDEIPYDVITDGNNGTNSSTKEVSWEGCPAQESQLNLWFSIAVSFMYLSFTGIGYLIKHAGTRLTRTIFFFIYLIGTLCLAFASPEIPWLLLPGLCCIGTGGLTMLATNLQVSYLHPRLRSTIVAIFTGLFDFSSINKQIVRVAYESGIARKTSYVFITVLFAIIIAISTLFFLPKMNISDEFTEKQEERRKNTKRNKAEMATDNTQEHGENHEQLLKPEVKDAGFSSNVDFRTTVEKSRPTLMSTILSFTCIMHLFWVFVHALRFVTFIGQLNVWLENIFNEDETKVGEMLAIFSYMTMGAIGTALFCGFVYDYQRKRYMNAGDIRRVYIPVVLPMCLVIFYSIGTTIFCYINHSVAPYIAFALFTFFRSSLFTVAVAFFGDAFPADYFGVLFGFIQLSAGLAGLVQYPLFKWYEAYEGSYMHVNILLLALQVSTFIHPVILYIKGRRDKGDVSNPFRQDYIINVPSTA